MKLKNYLTESSLSRLWKHNEEHDCGAMTAFRVATECGEGTPYTKKDNKARNLSLLSKLKSKGYSITSLKGKYPEGGKETKETSFFIVDITDGGMLKKDLKILGKEFEQDSILYIPKGAILNKANAVLIKTNNCKNNELKKETFFEKGKLGYTSKFYTSYVNGRPFIFEEIGNEIKYGSGFTAMAMGKYSKMKWEDLK